MSWEELHEVVKNWKDLSIERPFIQQQAPSLLDATHEGLSKKYPDLELATLAISELEHRESTKAKNSASKIREMLSETGHEPISWLTKTRKNLAFLKFEDIPNSNYTTSLYVILRDGYTDMNGRYGIYVGQTIHTPERRFEQHVNGENAGHGLESHGIQLLYSIMWPWQKVPGARRLCYEAALHRALELNNSGGPKLSGDAVHTNEWPTGFQMLLQEQLF